MTTTEIMKRLCHSHRALRPGDYRLWFINANPRFLDVIRVVRGLAGPWFEVAR